MSTENASLARPFKFGARASTSDHLLNASRGHISSFSRSQRRVFGGTPASVDDRAPADDVLLKDEFLRELHREKRRAERSKSPLSLALFRTDQHGVNAECNIDDLLEILQGAKRETDILGQTDDNTLVVLCPDTDGDGIIGFTGKLGILAKTLSYRSIVATYPDHLFDNFDSVIRHETELHGFLTTDSLATGGREYALKFWLDMIGALLALCLFAPLMAVVAVIIALTSPGPIIFRQTRLGKKGVPFVVYKFRSMVTGGDDTIHRAFVAKLIKVGNGVGAIPGHDIPTYKIRSDPRVTSIGRVIRKTSIDEFPQLFNVLKGDMSLVGPRPPIAYEASNYEPWHLRRILATKPGLTGLWQVEGRSKVSFNEMVRMDLRYIRRSSLALDIKILLKTVLVVLRCDGAN